MIKVKEDLTGKRFGRLTVLEQAEDHIYPSGKRRAQWWCECSCKDHNIVKVIDCNLKSGNTQSCGCYNKEVAKHSKIKRNKYNLDNEYGICFLNDNSEVLFDKEDYDLIKDYTWFNDSHGYAKSQIMNDGEITHIKMHRLIMCPPNEMDIDHINHNTLDNRRSNLRIVTTSQNMMNCLLRTDNVSGITGICWNCTKQKWQAYIDKNKTRLHLGYFDDIENAIKTRKEAEKKYFGNFAYNANNQCEVN